MDFFESYLTKRKQCVAINDSLSDFQLITCGVPQGSILGPLLFILYINDIIYFSSILQFVMFADDTNLFMSNLDLNLLIKSVNNELDNVSKWLQVNKLSLNVKKTHFIIVCKLKAKVYCF